MELYTDVSPLAFNSCSFVFFLLLSPRLFRITYRFRANSFGNVLWAPNSSTGWWIYRLSCTREHKQLACGRPFLKKVFYVMVGRTFQNWWSFIQPFGIATINICSTWLSISMGQHKRVDGNFSSLSCSFAFNLRPVLFIIVFIVIVCLLWLCSFRDVRIDYADYWRFDSEWFE